MKAAQYIKYKNNLKKVIRESFMRLSHKYDIVVIEGAGSPAEINLKSHDIVNLKMAEYAKAPVILVGDIDKGGVFAWIAGTLELLNKKEKAMIQGIIINKFRGDKVLLAPGIRFLEKRTSIKVLGVVPYFKNIKIPEEDSVPLDTYMNKNKKRKDTLHIDVIYLPHISNFTDFDALEKEADVALKYIKRAEEFNNPDIIIIPGSKNTIADLMYLKKTGLAQQIISSISHKPSTVLLGICGGYQMLGKKIFDKHSLESNAKEIDGLGLLPVNTVLEKRKVLAQIKAREIASGLEISGYEIHHGSSGILEDYTPIFEISESNGKQVKYFDGVKSSDGRIFATYIHGLFDCDVFRRNWLNRIRQKKGWPALAQKSLYNPDKEFDKLAKLLRENIDIKLVYKILG
jgi:adenosylcobyric acid synthase